VADFVGTNNLLSGASRGAACGDRLVVATAHRSVPRHRQRLHREDVRLAIRPENISLGASATSDGNVIRGRIAFASYLGNTLRYDRGNGRRAGPEGRHPRSMASRAAGRRKRDVAATFPASVTLAVGRRR
jgi:ABC-type Fe3+/spermidine/putrescine transport system ATPase subunit